MRRWHRIRTRIARRRALLMQRLREFSELCLVHWRRIRNAMARRRARWLRLPLTLRLFILFCGLAVFCGTGEWWASQRPLYVPDWQLGGQESRAAVDGHPIRLWGMYEGVRENAGASATINRFGIRGDVPEMPRPEGRQRAVVIGDSSFFGHGVEDDATNSAKLQAALRAEGMDIDVVNCAISGYSIAQATLLMDEVCWGFDPTLVIVATLWSDNSWEHFRDEDLLRARSLANSNPLVHSAFFKWFVYEAGRWLPAARPKPVFWDPLEDWSSGLERRVPLARYGTLMDGLIREAAERGAGVLLVKPTNVFLVTGAAIGLPSWQPYMNVMKALSEHHGVPLVDLTQTQRAAFEEERVTQDDLLMDKMHPTPLANDMIAGDWKRALMSAGWPNEPLLGKAEPADLSAIEDVPLPTSGRDLSFGSPQRNLFPSTEGEVATWTLVGQLSSENYPVHVDLLAVDGRTLERRDFSVGGMFTFDVPMSAGHITLHAWSETGERVSMELIAGTSDIELIVP